MFTVCFRLSFIALYVAPHADALAIFSFFISHDRYTQIFWMYKQSSMYMLAPFS